MNGTSHSFGYDSPFALFALTNNPALCTALHQRANKTLVNWAGRFVTAIFVDTSRNTPKYFFQIIVKYYILSFNNNQEEQ